MYKSRAVEGNIHYHNTKSKKDKRNLLQFIKVVQ